MKQKLNNIDSKTIVFLSGMCIILLFILMWFIYKYSECEIEISELKVNQIKKEEIVKKDELTKDDYIKMRQQEIEELELIEDEMIKFIKFKGICTRYEESTGINNDIVDSLHKQFNMDEIYLIQRTIETECYQTDFMSKVNVASVILNRLKHEKFGNTVEDIIKSPNQFAYGRRYITYDTVLALEYASYFGDTTKGALFFHSMNKTDTFNGANFIFKDLAGHHFYG